MGQAGALQLLDFAGFSSLPDRAEQSSLPDATVDLVWNQHRRPAFPRPTTRATPF